PGEVRGVNSLQGRPPELRRQSLQLPFALGREADVVVAVVAMGVALGHLAVAHQVEAGGGQGTLGAHGLETHRVYTLLPARYQKSVLLTPRIYHLSQEIMNLM